MPHVGGGSNSGGFHSGGSSGTTSIPRTDIYGRNHSNYYVRPGFYYGGIYVPYSRVHRGYHAISRYFFYFIISIILIVIGIVAGNVTKTDSKLQDYSLERYEEVYESGKNYESNILIEIIAYDNLTEIDYMPIVGDDIRLSIDEMFGNQKSYFGGIFATNLEKTNEKVSNLYSILAVSLAETNKNINNKYYTNNTKASKIINNTDFNLGSSTELQTAMDNFYDLTGYNISIDVNNYGSVYKPNKTIMWVLIGVAGFFIIIGVLAIVKASKAVKFINKEDEKGNLKEYYEGEVDYETQTSKYSMDEPYKYDKSEYEALKKEYLANKFEDKK